MISVRTWPLLLLPISLVSMGKDCPFPVLNGTFILSSESRQINNFPDNSKAFVECARGLKRKEGSNSIICTNGKWSDPELKCEKIDCGSPEKSPHLIYHIPSGTLFGARIQAKCERGYDLEGSSFRQCLVSGWSGRSKCILVTCDEPKPIDHGRFSVPRDVIQTDDAIEYSCDDDYTLVGNRSIICDDEGEYSSPPPRCIATKTPTITSPTTNKATTTATDTTTLPASATTHSNERLEDEFITPSMDLVPLVLIAVSAVLLAVPCILYLVYRNYKQRGSYNTGEGLRTKEELYQSL